MCESYFFCSFGWFQKKTEHNEFTLSGGIKFHDLIKRDVVMDQMLM